MYRVINVNRFFGLLSSHNFEDQNIKLKITIHDTFLAENSGSYIVHFQEGNPLMVSAKEDYDVEIALNIARFSSLVMGAINLKKLYQYGLIEISEKSLLRSLDRLFKTDEPPFTIEPF
jgi:predicted acetyltransferase